MRKRTVIVTLVLLSLMAASLVWAVTVNGRVVNKNGAAQAKVKVSFSATTGNRQYSAWTDSKGRFSIADVAEGSYKVKVRGRDKKEYTVKVDGSGMHPNPLVVD